MKNTQKMIVGYGRDIDAFLKLTKIRYFLKDVHYLVDFLDPKKSPFYPNPNKLGERIIIYEVPKTIANGDDFKGGCYALKKQPYKANEHSVSRLEVNGFSKVRKIVYEIYKVKEMYIKLNQEIKPLEEDLLSLKKLKKRLNHIIIDDEITKTIEKIWYKEWAIEKLKFNFEKELGSTITDMDKLNQKNKRLKEKQIKKNYLPDLKRDLDNLKQTQKKLNTIKIPEKIKEIESKIKDVEPNSKKIIR